MITDKEISKYWRDYDLFIILWFCISLWFVLSAISFLLSLVFLIFDLYNWFPLFLFGLVIPINILLKYGFGRKGLWLFNDKENGEGSGDFGDPVEIEKAGLQHKSKLYIVIWWWFRNHSWNFNRKFLPEWNHGQAEEFRVVKSNINTGNRWEWCSKDGVHGYHYIAARINGQIECRFSEAGPNYQRQMGSGGNEYRFRFKNLWRIFGMMVKRIF